LTNYENVFGILVLPHRILNMSSQEAITQVNTLLTSAAQICSGIKATYQAKPKLKIWNADIKVALKVGS
jgi:hypothetical protein